MFKNKEVKMIWCAKGGNNSNSVFEYLDYEAIKENPKIKTIDKKLSKRKFHKRFCNAAQKTIQKFLQILHSAGKTSSIRQYCCVQCKV